MGDEGSPAGGPFREARALLRQGALMAGGVTRRQPRLSGPRVVVLLHGFMATGSVLRPMASAVRRQTGLPTGIFSSPLYVVDFDDMVARFEAFMVEKVAPDAKVALVGHSLGGLVARWYVQERGGAARVDRLVTIATPHSGTRLARWAPPRLRPVLTPDNPTLVRLSEGRTAVMHIPHTAFIAGADVMVRPAQSAGHLPGAEVITLPKVGHNEIIYHPRVFEELGRVLR